MPDTLCLSSSDSRPAAAGDHAELRFSGDSRRLLLARRPAAHGTTVRAALSGAKLTVWSRLAAWCGRLSGGEASQLDDTALGDGGGAGGNELSAATEPWRTPGLESRSHGTSCCRREF